MCEVQHIQMLLPKVSVLTLGIPSRDSSADRNVLGAFLLINNSF